MRNWPLAVKIWLLCAGVTLSVLLGLVFVLPNSLKIYFTDQVFDILMGAQPSVFMVQEAVPAGTVTEIELPGESVDVPTLTIASTSKVTEPGQENPGSVAVVMQINDGAFSPASWNTVSHLFIYKGMPEAAPQALPAGFFAQIQQDAYRQQETVAKYSHQIGEKLLFYVVRQAGSVQEQPAYLVSYAWSSYRDDLARDMLLRLALIVLIIIVISWLPSMLVARYLTQPLVEMQDYTQRIAERDWHQPIQVRRNDEIGRLARSFETMRARLARQDEAQRTYLQHVSHELKTPVTVIRSYSQSILDDVYPKGDLAGSLNVIHNEADRLEKRIRDFIYLSKLNYLSTREPDFQAFSLTQAAAACVERFRGRRPDVDWTLQMDEGQVMGDADQWQVALENLLDNQLRYAQSRITVRLEATAGRISLRLWNDGPPIGETVLLHIFEPFAAGPGGEFGLGLAIVKQIMSLHQAEIQAVNEPEGGVAFYISVPVAL